VELISSENRGGGICLPLLSTYSAARASISKATFLLTQKERGHSIQKWGSQESQAICLQRSVLIMHTLLDTKQQKAPGKEVQVMKKTPIMLGIALVVIVSLLYAPSVIPDNVELTISGQLDLKAPPLDICASADGKWLYILSEGEVAIYSFLDDTVVNRISIDKAFDRMIYLQENNSLVVTSRSGNTLQIIQLELVFATSGLPFKGSEHAPVTVAVFSSYQ